MKSASRHGCSKGGHHLIRDPRVVQVPSRIAIMEVPSSGGAPRQPGDVLCSEHNEARLLALSVSNGIAVSGVAAAGEARMRSSHDSVQN